MSLEEKVEKLMAGRQEITVTVKRNQWVIDRIFKIVKNDTGYTVYDLTRGSGRYPWPIDILEDYL